MTSPDPQDLQAAYDESLADQVKAMLPVACFGSAAVYFVMHAVALLSPPAWNQNVLNAAVLLVAVFCIALGLLVQRRSLAGEQPHYVMMILAVCMIAHATLVLHVLDSAVHTLNLVLISLAMGFFFLKRFWFYAGAALIAIGWLSAFVLSSGAAGEWRLWGGAMMISLAMAVTLYEARRRTTLLLHGLRMEAQAVHQREVEMQSMMQEAQRRESLGILAGGIAHDFNNLLTVVRGNTELALARAGADKAQQILLSDVEKAAAKASALTQLMLVYAGRSRPVVSRFDFSARVSGNIDLVESSLPRGVRVCRTGQLDGQPLEADTTLIDQIVLNLLQNAADACAEQGGQITVGWGVCEIAEHERQQPSFAVVPGAGLHAFIRVSDDGPGIGAEIQARIFEPFFSTKFDGSGLGLAAVRGIVESHNGGLRLASTPKVGACFEVFLPLSEALVPDDASPVLELLEPQTPGEMLAGTSTLLVVDDQPAVRLLARRMLEGAGYGVMEAESGRSAVALLDAGSPVDLALVDLTMPDEDGLQVIEHLRERIPELPVVLMSGFDMNDVLAKEPHKPERIFYLDKPFSLQQLTGAVQKMLEA